MGGTYESFFLPQVVEQCKKPGYMVDLAAAVKSAVGVPVIAAVRIASGALAERIITEGKADLVGLARVFRMDPE
jgi:NADPH2 dehydrogenase